MDQRFRWDERLHRKSDFKQVFQVGRRYSTGGLAMWVYKHPEESAALKARLGLAIPKSYGNAVMRNRLKRLIREVFRLHKSQLPAGVDLVFMARSRLDKPRYQTVESLILRLWTLAKLQPSSPNS